MNAAVSQVGSGTEQDFILPLKCTVESTLHERFKDKRVNLVNPHKEFFNVSLDDIIKAVREYVPTAEVVNVAEAKEFRQTLALRGEARQTGHHRH